MDASEITVTADRLHPRIVLRSGSTVVGRTLSQEDMCYMLEAFAIHGAACQAVRAALADEKTSASRHERRAQARRLRKVAR